MVIKYSVPANPLEMSSQKEDGDGNKEGDDDEYKVPKKLITLEANKIKKEYRQKCADRMLQDEDLSGSDWDDEDAAEALFYKFKLLTKFDPNEVRKFICALKEQEYLWGELTTGKAALPLSEDLIDGEGDSDDLLSNKVSDILAKMS